MDMNTYYQSNYYKDFKSVNNDSVIHLSVFTRIKIFIIFCCIVTITNIEEYIAQSSENYIKHDLNFNSIQFKHFVLIVQIGKITGAILAILFFNWTNRKTMLIINLLSFSLSLLIYLISTHWWYISACRFIQGVTYIYPMVYSCQWINRFGLYDWKGVLLAVPQVALFLTNSLGHSMTAYFGQSKWIYSFSINGIGLALLSCALYCISDDYFNETYYAIPLNKTESNTNNTSDLSLFKIRTVIKDNTRLFNLQFCFFTLSRIIIVFTIAILNVILYYYLIDILMIKESTLIQSFNSICLFWGPIGGLLFSGIVCIVFGGYTNKLASRIVLLFSIICVISTHYLLTVDTFNNFLIASFGLLFFSNALIPLLIAMSLRSSSLKNRGTAYAINSCLAWFGGSILAQYAINTTLMNKDYISRVMIKYCLYLLWANLLLILVFAIRQTKVLKNKSKKNMNHSEEPDGIPLQVYHSGGIK